MKEKVLGYTAGIIDGEGCISVCYYNYRATTDKHKNKRMYKRHRLQIQVANTNYKLIHWLIAHWGGKSYERKRKPREARCWIWMLLDGWAGAFLEQLLPYLVVKKERAKLAIRFRATIGVQGQRLSDDSILKERHKISAKIKKLNGNIGDPKRKGGK